MNIQTFNGLPEGARVRVIKSGKVYELLARHTWEGGHTSTTFQQIRANSKGVVGRYGPMTHFKKPENLELVPS